jgi:hypothetical protein
VSSSSLVVYFPKYALLLCDFSYALDLLLGIALDDNLVCGNILEPAISVLLGGWDKIEQSFSCISSMAVKSECPGVFIIN